jgi:hypothetical protein
MIAVGRNKYSWGFIVGWWYWKVGTYLKAEITAFSKTSPEKHWLHLRKIYVANRMECSKIAYSVPL